MLRRKFFGTVAVGLGATALPVWLSRSFGLRDETCPDLPDTEPAPTPSDPPKAHCGTSAGIAAKPILVLVIPADDPTSQYDRGHAFGEILNHGSDTQRGLFALFDVVCRPVAKLATDVQAVVRGEPLMVVVDPHVAAPILPLTAPLPQFPEERTWQGDWRDREAAEERTIQQRIDVLTDLLHTAASPANLASQAARERAALSCDEAELFADLPDSLDRISPALVDRAAAMTMLAARGADEDTRARLWALLAAAARIRLTDRPLSGAPWARGGGCGTIVEGEEQHHGMACGMGHVPAKSTRFLKFYASPW